MDRGVTEQAANIDAIEAYFGRTPAQTEEAAGIKDDFLRYAAGLTPWGREFDPGVYDTVRNYKLSFNRANAVTEDERAWVEEQALRGMSSEEMTGEADHRLSTGEYATRTWGADQFFHQVKMGLLVAGGIWLAIQISSLKSVVGSRRRAKRTT